MKQIVQNARTGKLELAEVPAPATVDGQDRVAELREARVPEVGATAPPVGDQVRARPAVAMDDRGAGTGPGRPVEHGGQRSPVVGGDLEELGARQVP